MVARHQWRVCPSWWSWTTAFSIRWILASCWGKVLQPLHGQLSRILLLLHLLPTNPAFWDALRLVRPPTWWTISYSRSTNIPIPTMTTTKIPAIIAFRRNAENPSAGKVGNQFLTSLALWRITFPLCSPLEECVSFLVRPINYSGHRPYRCGVQMRVSADFHRSNPTVPDVSEIHVESRAIAFYWDVHSFSLSLFCDPLRDGALMTRTAIIQHDTLVHSLLIKHMRYEGYHGNARPFFI